MEESPVWEQAGRLNGDEIRLQARPEGAVYLARHFKQADGGNRLKPALQSSFERAPEFLNRGDTPLTPFGMAYHQVEFLPDLNHWLMAARSS